MAAREPQPGAAARNSVRRQYRLKSFGLLFIFLTILLLLGALNSSNNLLYGAFGLALAAVLVSGVLSGAPMMSLRVEALPPVLGRVGEPVTLRYRVRNRGRVLPLFALAITEHKPRRQRLLDGAIDYPEVGLPHLGPGEEVVVESRPIARQRGRYDLTAVEVSTIFPFGLLGKAVIVPSPRSLLVLPAALPIAPGRVIIPRVRGRALQPRDRIGRDGDVYGVREYVPGDSPRSIAWRPSARSDDLLVRQPADVAARRLRIELGDDIRPATAAGEGAIALVASLAEMAATAGIAVTVVGVGDATDRDVRPLLTALAMWNGQADSFGTKHAQDRAVRVVATGRTSLRGEVPVLSATDARPWLRRGTDLPSLLAPEPVRERNLQTRSEDAAVWLWSLLRSRLVSRGASA